LLLASRAGGRFALVSGGRRRAEAATEDQGRDEGDRAIAAGAGTNPELIVVTDRDRSKLVLLEVYLGVSSRIGEWSEW
jgi:hypothetical protein